MLFLFRVLLVSDLKAQTKMTEANGLTIAYESFGDEQNETILLIHGTASQLTDWPEEFCKKLSNKGFRVIRFDNRDIGLSTKLDSLGEPDWKNIFPLIGTCKPAPVPYTLNDMADDAVGLLEALAIPRAHIVGASMGGAIAQLVAIQHPERVLSLASIMASSGNPGLPSGEEYVIQEISKPPPATSNPEILADHLVRIAQVLGAVDEESVLKKAALASVSRSWYPEGSARHAAAVIIGDSCDRRKQLENLDVPTVVIHGDSDPLVTLESGMEVAATIPNAELRVVKGMGHTISLSFTDILVESIVNNAKKVKL